MRGRVLLALASAACMTGAAALVGGKPGWIGGSLAALFLAIGVVFGVSVLITAAAGTIAAIYLVALLLTGAPVDLQAPLIGTLLVVALETGHLSLEGERYMLPGGMAALTVRAAITAGVCLAGLAVAWLILLSSFVVPLPGETASIVAGVAGVIGVFAVLVMLRRSSTVI